MKRTYVVRTGADGRAKIGTVLIDFESFGIEDLPVVNKAFGEDAKPHHPKTNEPILLLIGEGSHTITVAGDGQAEQSLTLNEGDTILFVDYEPQAVRNLGQEFDYAGHRSAPGQNGAVLNPSKVTSLDPNEELDLGFWELNMESWEPLAS